MGEKEEVTTMVLKVDLQCHKCYKKVKKVLCKIPQIRDPIYDEKQNQVVIKVVCCSPEKIRGKICCKGGSAIKSIEIKEPEKPKDDCEAKTKGDGKDDCEAKTKGDGKDDNKPKPKGDDKPECDCKPKCDDKPKCDGKTKCDCKPKDPAVLGYPMHVCACCIDCYQGHADGLCYSGCGGRPCYSGCGRRPCFSGCGGRPCYNGCGGRPCYSGCGGRPCYSGCGDSYGGDSMGYCITRLDYFSEEKASACIVM